MVHGLGVRNNSTQEQLGVYCIVVHKLKYISKSVLVLI